jgi:hypothetical protein
MVVDNMANLDVQQIEKAKQLLPIFKTVGDMYEFDDKVNARFIPNFTKYWFHYLLMGICSRESHFGLLLDKNLTGDGGHGRGLMQIDDRSHAEWISLQKWKNPAANIEYGADVWMDNFNYFIDHYDLVGGDAQLVWAATAAYNCGAGNVRKSLIQDLGVDARTTGKDYSADVRVRMKFLSSLGLFNGK